MKITAERLRQDSGYIGKVRYIDGNKYVQVTRSPGIGVIVCTGLDKNDNPKIGWALISPDEIYKPTTKENFEKGNSGINWEAAQELAKARAEKFNEKPCEENPCLPSSLTAQVKHFKERAKAYFNPDKYSRKSEKRPGKLYKIWVDETDTEFDGDLTKNLNID